MELALDQALQKGIEAHKAGKVQEADRYYTAVLKANPNHPDANHNMGVLAVGVGKVQEALPFFKIALEANPSIAQYWLSYIDALIKLDRSADAKAVFDQAKSKGAKGDAFEQIEQRLDISKNPVATMVGNPDIQDPPQTQSQQLIDLHSKGQFQEALNQASHLLPEYPSSLVLYNIVGAANKGLGKLEEAIEAYNKVLSIKPDYAKAHNNMGVTLKANGKLVEAIEAYTKAISLKPDYAEAHYNMGLALQDQGKLEIAIDAYKNAVSIKPGYAKAHNNMGNALQEQGKPEEAIEAYNKALSIKPDYADAYNNVGNALKDQGKLEEAIEAYNKALSIKPDYADANNNMGVALQEQGKLDEAVKTYKVALSIKADLAETWVNIADALEKNNKLDRLEKWLEKAFNSFPRVPADLRFMKAKLLWRKGKFEETSSLISDIKFETISEIRKRDFLQLSAKCFEKSKSFEKAYECYIKSNSIAKKTRKYLSLDAEKYFQGLKHDLNILRSSSLKELKAQISENSDLNPVFLVGFPRSGTTLLDTILRSHSKINIVEEMPMLQAADRFLNTKGIDDPAVQVINTDLLSKARKIYKGEFQKQIDTSSKEQVYIDKLPLSLLRAPLIRQLYPDAKFILALRHPMDTILSCWMQNFKLNEAMANMVDLERIVEFYCIAMETFKICRTNYNLNVHEIRYEDLINNFHKESESVVQFLNLQWESEMENYQDTAIKRGRINTPSYSQVIQPIYKDAQYRWLNYRKYLEQYLDQVKPWISEFGY